MMFRCFIFLIAAALAPLPSYSIEIEFKSPNIKEDFPFELSSKLKSAENLLLSGNYPQAYAIYSKLVDYLSDHDEVSSDLVLRTYIGGITAATGVNPYLLDSLPI